MGWFGGNETAIREGREYLIIEKKVPATPDQLHRLRFMQAQMQKDGYSVLIVDDDENGSTKKLLKSVHQVLVPKAAPTQKEEHIED